MADALANLVKTRQLKIEPISVEEMRGFLGHAEQSLADAAVNGVRRTGSFGRAGGCDAACE
jgi:hypothetical protein